MSALIALIQILGIPLNVLIAALKFFVVGTLHRKLQGSFVNNLKMALFKSALNLSVKNSKLIAMSNPVVLKIVSYKHKQLTSTLPHYGEAYDQNSFWIVKQPQRKPSDPIIIYLHGGGYFLQTQGSQIESIISIYKLIDEEKRNKTSILLLDYNLVCNGYKFPSQLEQLHETYVKLLGEKNDNINLMGDSAGGHMAINYLHYLNYTSKQTIQPSNLILISPWIKIDLAKDMIMPGKSYYENFNYDMITYKVFENKNLDEFTPSYVFSDPKYAFAEPTDKKKWSNIPFFKDPKRGVFVIVGEDESFRDEVLEWSEVALEAPVFNGVTYGDSSNKLIQKLEYNRKNDTDCKVQMHIEPWGVHDSIFFFENVIIGKVKSGEYKSLRDIDSTQFFGISRVVDFINENL